MINNSGAKSNINWWNNPAVMAELEHPYILLSLIKASICIVGMPGYCPAAFREK